MAKLFTDRYPNIALWVQHSGWIEVGEDEFSRSLVRVLGPGGLEWEWDGPYDALDDALAAADVAIEGWYLLNGGPEP